MSARHQTLADRVESAEGASLSEAQFYALERWMISLVGFMTDEAVSGAHVDERREQAKALLCGVPRARQEPRDV